MCTDYFLFIENSYSDYRLNVNVLFSYFQFRICECNTNMELKITVRMLKLYLLLDKRLYSQMNSLQSYI